MRIACLQFNPQLGKIAHNLKVAEAVLQRAAPMDLDLLVLPEMAFSGYNFQSLPQISVHLEPTAAGPSTAWARDIARRLGCHVIVGYPEHCTQSPSTPQGSISRFNSAVLVSPKGNVLTNYRKSFLYTTDESWAQEGPGFYAGDIPGGVGKMSMGICMDLNPKGFVAPFEKYEFANHVLDSGSSLAVVPMAWLTMQTPESIIEQAQVPDAETSRYWIQRLQPILDRSTVVPGETIFVTCNRIGFEGDAVFAGTSTIVGIEKGNVKVYGCLGRGTEDLLVCDVPGAKFGGVD